MKTRLSLPLILFCLAAVLAAPVAIAQQSAAPPAPMTAKQLEAMARALVDEGKALEKKGQLAEAREKFLDAEGYFSTKGALEGLSRVRESVQQKAEALLEEARPACQKQSFNDCVNGLEKALEPAPEKTAALHNDLALYYQRLNDRAKAMSHVDALLALTHEEKERLKLAELRTAILLGVKTPAMNGDQQKMVEEFNQAYLKDDSAKSREGEETGTASAAGLCERVRNLASAKTIAAVAYNQAKCESEEGDDAAAAALLTQYLQLAPDALDASDVQISRDNLLALAALPGETGANVRSRFAAATRDLDYRRYDRAMLEYQAARQLAPNFPLVYWRLALLAEATGDVAQSHAYLQDYLQVETDAGRKAEAQRHLDSLNEWRSEYEYNVTEAHDLIADLLLRSMGLSSEGLKRNRDKKKRANVSGREHVLLSASEALSPPYVERQLDRARGDLDEVIQLFPIAPEANQMLALLDLENNDWPSAFRRFDAVASAGMPVAFYAQDNSSTDKKVVRAVKIEITEDSVRLVYLSSYDPRKRISAPPAKPAGEDDLGNLAVSPALLPDPNADAVTIPETELQGIQTDKSFVYMKRGKEQILLAPVFMTAYTPTEGKTAREFGNEYTRMFVRYLGYENARLGKEGMTFGEKVKLAGQIEQTGMSIFSDVTSGGLGSIDALRNTIKLSQMLHTDLKNLQQTMADQRRALEDLQFKVIPSAPVELAFKDHL
jgi:tetratricopeptide (TPR) repeat protein